MTETGQEQWLRIFDVPETKLHQDGFTVYKIVSQIFHHSFPEASTSLEIWRRYSTILKFHKEIIKLCHHLQLAECPPVYSRPSLINRFDHEIIESRRMCTLLLLTYCAKHPSIYLSGQFTRFFKEDYNVKKKKLSFSALREKKRSSALASSLGLSEASASLYAHLEQNTSSSEDISGDKTPHDEVENLPSRISQKPLDSAQVFSKNHQKDSKKLRTLPKMSGPLASQSVAVVDNTTEDNFVPSQTLDPSAHEIAKTSQRWNGAIVDAKSQPTRRFAAGGRFFPKKALRIKTTEYLQKAEQLIARFSLQDSKHGQVGTLAGNNNKENSVSSTAPYMKNYSVVGISGKMIVAIDIPTQETVAIKIISKSPEDKSSKLVLPASIPHMVPLIRYHETDFAFYLVLKYVSGGKLWNHLKKFIKQPSSHTYVNQGPQTSTTYEGQRLIGESKESSKLSTLNTQTNQEFDTSEADQRSFSFSTNLAVAECKSSVETYSNIPQPQRSHYRSSLSNVIDFPPVGGSEQQSMDRLTIPSHSKICDAPSHSKSKSLEDINSGREDRFDMKSFTIGSNKCKEVANKGSNLGDCWSIGSDTLSGVSDDFSCSSLNPMHEVEASEQTAIIEEDSCTVPPLSSVTFSSAENSTSIAFDVKSLIKNSKKLIEDVNKTLEQSKRQLIQTLPTSNDSSSQPSEPLNLVSIKESEPPSTAVKSASAKQRELSYSQEHSSPHLGPFTSTKEANHIQDEDTFQQDCHNFPSVLPTYHGRSSTFNDPSENAIALQDHSLDEPRCSPSLFAPTKLVSMSFLIENYSSVKVNQQIPEGLVRVWVSQVISAMDHLHQQGIIWGDFNPSNILLDDGGSILVTYRSFYGRPEQFVGSSFRANEDHSYNWMSSLGYVSPELSNPVSIVTRSSDWWSVGALLYHLLTGKDLAYYHPSGITSHTHINFACPLSEEAASLISKLLCVHPMERLGSSSTGVQEIMDHPFFFGIAWPDQSENFIGFHPFSRS